MEFDPELFSDMSIAIGDMVATWPDDGKHLYHAMLACEVTFLSISEQLTEEERERIRERALRVMTFLRSERDGEV